jgi:hypothetical protein
MFKETRDQQSGIPQPFSSLKVVNITCDQRFFFFFSCENFHQKTHWKLGPVKGMKGKRVKKSDGTIKFL